MVKVYVGRTLLSACRQHHRARWTIHQPRDLATIFNCVLVGIKELTTKPVLTEIGAKPLPQETHSCWSCGSMRAAHFCESCGKVQPPAHLPLTATSARLFLAATDNGLLSSRVTPTSYGSPGSRFRGLSWCSISSVQLPPSPDSRSPSEMASTSPAVSTRSTDKRPGRRTRATACRRCQPLPPAQFTTRTPRNRSSPPRRPRFLIAMPMASVAFRRSRPITPWPSSRRRPHTWSSNSTRRRVRGPRCRRSCAF